MPGAVSQLLTRGAAPAASGPGATTASGAGGTTDLFAAVLGGAAAATTSQTGTSDPATGGTGKPLVVATDLTADASLAAPADIARLVSPWAQPAAWSMPAYAPPGPVQASTTNAPTTDALTDPAGEQAIGSSGAASVSSFVSAPPVAQGLSSAFLGLHSLAVPPRDASVPSSGSTATSAATASTDAEPVATPPGASSTAVATASDNSALDASASGPAASGSVSGGTDTTSATSGTTAVTADPGPPSVAAPIASPAPPVPVAVTRTTSSARPQDRGIGAATAPGKPVRPTRPGDAPVPHDVPPQPMPAASVMPTPVPPAAPPAPLAAASPSPTVSAASTSRQSVTTGVPNDGAAVAGPDASAGPAMAPVLVQVETGSDRDDRGGTDRDGDAVSGTVPPSAPQAGSFAAAVAEAAPAAATSRAAPQPPPAAQVAVRIGRAVTEGSRSLTMELRPAELGRVEVKLDFRAGGAVGVQMTMDRPETYQAFTSGRAGLEHQLAQAGVELSGSLDLRFGNNGAGTGQGNTGQGNAGGGGSRVFAPVEDAEPAAVTAAPPPRAGSSLIDIEA